MWFFFKKKILFQFEYERFKPQNGDQMHHRQIYLHCKSAVMRFNQRAIAIATATDTAKGAQCTTNASRNGMEWKNKICWMLNVGWFICFVLYNQIATAIHHTNPCYSIFNIKLSVTYHNLFTCRLNIVPWFAGL